MNCPGMDFIQYQPINYTGFFEDNSLTSKEVSLYASWPDQKVCLNTTDHNSFQSFGSHA